MPHVDPALSRQAATNIVRTLRAQGHTAYFAGGCVRDELLGFAPSDYDVATDATPDRIRALFPHTNEVGAAFGVMLVRTGRVVNEVATFRSEGTYSDKRRPDDVRFGSAAEDAARRDFTVNALFLDPLDTTTDQPRAPAGGRVIDLVSGLADLRSRVLRAVGDPEKRLAEDHLRALRAVRLSAKLGFTIEPGTAAAITRHASELAGVSRERIGDEVRRMLAHPSRAAAVGTLAGLGLEAAVLPDPAPSARGERTLAALPADASVPLALAAWALDRGLGVDFSGIDPVAAAWRRHLCLSNDERDAFCDILRSLARLRTDWLQLGTAPQKRLAAAPAFAGARVLLGIAEPALAAAVAARVEELRGSVSGLAPDPLITGDDLIAAGLAPGPSFKAILDGVYDAQLEGTVSSRDQALELARSLRV